ncbi:MAG: hypothetical protein ACM3SW_03980 [Actinomycetota bacterium]
MTENTRGPLTTKVHLYHALYLFNRGCDITLAGLKRLEELGVFRNENLSDHTVALELARCDANEELTSVLQGFEEDESVFWDDRRHEIEKRLADPDDVFFEARDRRQEIKEQMKQLERGLARQHTKRRSEAKKRRRAKAKNTKVKNTKVKKKQSA